MRKQLLAGLALLAAAIATPAIAAPSLGDTVTCGGLNFDCSADTSTVGSGVEFGLSVEPFGVLLLADFAANSLTIRNANNLDFAGGVGFPDGFFVQFTGMTTPFTSATLGALDGVSGFSAANLSLDSDGFLTLDLSNTSFQPNGSLQVQIDQTAAVPEPATWALMILGFGAVGHALRRRKGAAPKVALA